MIITNLNDTSNIYTSNVYLVRSIKNSIQDLNTLIDVGRDPNIIKKIYNESTGVGKKKIDQVVLTHSHYDHSNLLPLIRKTFNPVVFAYSSFLKGVDRLLENGDFLTIGDKVFEIIHTPGHSSDSITLYCRDERIMFTGDTQIIIYTKEGSYSKEFVESMKRISRCNIKTIYPGHGKPIATNCNEKIKLSLKNILNGKIVGVNNNENHNP